MGRPPPLTALRTFKAVAVRRSFSLAAEDLAVSQSAVSQQIKALEDHLGRRLFIRNVHGLLLTEQAERLLAAVTQAFSLIDEALNGVTEMAGEGSIHASTSFVMRWLMPRLRDFEASHPKTPVRISVGDREDTPSVADVEIVYGFDAPRSADPEPLMHEWLLPVCSPGHLSREKAEFASLAGCRLLLNAPDGRDWKLWARELPYPLSGLDDGLKAAMRLPTDTAAIEMALAGFGVALANVHYIQKPLRDGALVPAIAIGPIKLGAHYVFRHAPQKPAVRAFVKWVRAAASASETDAALETAGVKVTSHLRRGSDAGEHRR